MLEVNRSNHETLAVPRTLNSLYLMQLKTLGTKLLRNSPKLMRKTLFEDIPEGTKIIHDKVIIIIHVFFKG